MLKKTPPSVGVDLVFVDGEDYGDFTKNQDVLIGSTYFASHLPSPDYRPMFGVLWDMIGDAIWRFTRKPNSMQQAPEVVKRVWDAAADLGYGRYFIPAVDELPDDRRSCAAAQGRSAGDRRHRLPTTRPTTRPGTRLARSRPSPYRSSETWRLHSCSSERVPAGELRGRFAPETINDRK